MDKYFSVIDVETTWDNQVMSIGVVIADCETKDSIGSRYYIVEPECNMGGMFASELMYPGAKVYLKSDREHVIEDITEYLDSRSVNKIFAYNASFDKSCLPELGGYSWYDIMRLAAYKQYNKMIPDTVECCGTGRMKKGYGVEQIYRMLDSDDSYLETHNAIFDAIDELKIVKLLGREIEEYEIALLVNKPKKRTSRSGANTNKNIQKENYVFEPGLTFDRQPEKSFSMPLWERLFSRNALVERVLEGGKEELSDKMILSYIISPNFFRRMLSLNEYQHVMKLYGEISCRRDTYITDRIGLQNRAYRILQEICHNSEIEMEKLMEKNHPMYKEMFRKMQGD